MAENEVVDEDLLLVRQAQQGDVVAFGELVTRHRAKIYAMIRSLIHHETDAWDLSQEVFIRAWQAIGRFESKAKFSTWLYRIAHNLVYDFSRKRKIQVEGEFNDELLNRERIDSSASTAPSVGEQPDDSLSRQELRKRIKEAMEKLSIEHRSVVLLKDIQGLSYKEIADVMETSIGTVMSRLFYARQKLQTLLRDEYERH